MHNKGDKLTFLQINLHRCRLAQDLLLQYVSEKGIHVVIISELYRILSHWYSDSNADAAIWVTPLARKKFINIKKITNKKGIVAAAVDELKIYSCYISPNIRRHEFLKRLNELEREVTRLGSKNTIIAGDFNAKSIAWGSKNTDKRGYDIMEMAYQTRPMYCKECRQSHIRKDGQNVTN
ncbi:uncharacterized protein LOC144475474 [Augochlora pura]